MRNVQESILLRVRRLVFPTLVSTGVAIGAAVGYIAYDQNKPHSREGRIFTQSYHDFVQEAVEQVFRDGSIRVDGVEYAINRTDNLKS